MSPVVAPCISCATGIEEGAIRMNSLFYSVVRSMCSTAAHQKHKTPYKRATKLFDTLRQEEFARLRGNRQFPELFAGDSIEVQRLPYATAPESEMEFTRGVVIAVRRKASDTSVRLLNNEFETPVVREITLYQPLVKNITVLQRAFIHEGKKRVRRSRIYYLEKRDPEFYTVKYRNQKTLDDPENLGAGRQPKNKGKK